MVDQHSRLLKVTHGFPLMLEHEVKVVSQVLLAADNADVPKPQLQKRCPAAPYARHLSCCGTIHGHHCICGRIINIPEYPESYTHNTGSP